MQNSKHTPDRRAFIKSTASIGALSLLTGTFDAHALGKAVKMKIPFSEEKSIIGAYGTWAAGLQEEPRQLSLRNATASNFKQRKQNALATASEMVASPEFPKQTTPRVDKQYSYDGLHIEELSWQLPCGNRTQAILLKPEASQEKLPAVLGLHDHGGNKYFGKRKITKTASEQHPMMERHQKNYYEGAPWANELARRGYVVLVPDSFAFASRRVLFHDMSEIPWGHCTTKGMSDDDPEKQENIDAYNRWASEHEHILSKSLFCAGTTWPGVFLSEDQAALDILSSRIDVDKSRLGCAGLSGGGLRTVYLGGLDPRIKCAIAVGFMSTWNDFLMHKAYTHTWMTYTPGLPRYLDFPEILGLRAPLPTMTLNNSQDQLFTLSEMHRADKILKEVFSRSKAPDHYKGHFYEGPHKFDLQMQSDAFAWFDRWLKK